MDLTIKLLCSGFACDEDTRKQITAIASPDCFAPSKLRALMWARLCEVTQTQPGETWRTGTSAGVDMIDVAFWVFGPDATALREAVLGPAEAHLIVSKRDELIANEFPKPEAIFDCTTNAERVIDMAYRVRELAAQARAVKAVARQNETFKKATEAGYVMSVDALAEAQAQLAALTEMAAERAAGKRRQRWRAHVANAVDPNRPARVAIPSGLEPLDRMTKGGPLAVGELSVFGKGTSVGKSLFSGTLLRGVLCQNAGKMPVTAKDPSIRELRDRMKSVPTNVRALLIGVESKVADYLNRWEEDFFNLTIEELSDKKKRATAFDEKSVLLDDFRRLLDADDCPVEIIDASDIAAEYGGTGREIDSIIKFIRQWAAEQRRQAKKRGDDEPVLAVVIDYVQIIKPGAGSPKRARTEELAEICEKLCGLADKECLAVGVTAQLNGRIGHQTPETATVREAADIDIWASNLIYGDAIGHKAAKALRANKDLIAKSGDLVELAASTIKYIHAKGRNTGEGDDVFLHVAYTHQRITAMSQEQHEMMTRQMGGDPIAWARKYLPEPGKKKREPDLAYCESPLAAAS